MLNSAGPMPKKRWKIGYKIRLVFSDEPTLVDSIAITINQMTAGNHAFKIRSFDEIKSLFPLDHPSVHGWQTSALITRERSSQS